MKNPPGLVKNENAPQLYHKFNQNPAERKKENINSALIKFVVALIYDKESEKEAEEMSRYMTSQGSCVIKLPVREDYDYLEIEYSKAEVDQMYLTNMKSILIYGLDACFFSKSQDNKIINELLDYSVKDGLSCTAVYQTTVFDAEKYYVYEEYAPFRLLRSVDDINSMLLERIRNARRKKSVSCALYR